MVLSLFLEDKFVLALSLTHTFFGLYFLLKSFIRNLFFFWRSQLLLASVLSTVVIVKTQPKYNIEEDIRMC